MKLSAEVRGIFADKGVTFGWVLLDLIIVRLNAVAAIILITRGFSAVLLATAAMSFGSIQHGSAADMGLPPVKAAPVVGPAPWSWTGFYIGGNVGAGWGTTETTADIGATVAPFITPATLAFQLPLSSQTVNGFLGGGQVGWNWQTGVLVFGVEGDVEWET